VGLFESKHGFQQSSSSVHMQKDTQAGSSTGIVHCHILISRGANGRRFIFFHVLLKEKVLDKLFIQIYIKSIVCENHCAVDIY